MSVAGGVAAVVVEADGGSRGNPGPSAYGAVLKDAATGEVIAEDGTAIGEATNNVAEYQGLIAGLRLAARFAPEATVEVRMDSKLVIEQMSGRWQVKHPELRALVLEARRLAPPGTAFTWVPREDNGHADRLVNDALDGRRQGAAVLKGEPTGGDDSLMAELSNPDAGSFGPITTFILMRHGVTAHTVSRKFSSGMGGENPPLSAEGREQARLTGQWLRTVAGRIDEVVASPVRRTHETAQIVADLIGKQVALDVAFAEAEYGEWDGKTFGEVADAYPELLERWFLDLDVTPPGGESYVQVKERVVAGLTRLRERHRGQTVLLVSHVNPIKSVVTHALNAPMEAFHRIELAPCSLTVVSWFEEVTGADAMKRATQGGGLLNHAALRMLNALPPEREQLRHGAAHW